MPAGNRFSSQPSQQLAKERQPRSTSGLAENPLEHPLTSTRPPSLPANRHFTRTSQTSREVTTGPKGGCQEFTSALYLQLLTGAQVGRWRQVLISTACNYKLLSLLCYGGQKACTVSPKQWGRGVSFFCWLVGVFFPQKEKIILEKSKEHFNKI